MAATNVYYGCQPWATIEPETNKLKIIRNRILYHLDDWWWTVKDFIQYVRRYKK